MNELPIIRIRKAELAIARLKLEYHEFWANHVQGHAGHVSPLDVHTALRDYGIAQQEVLIAEARLEEVLPKD